MHLFQQSIEYKVGNSNKYDNEYNLIENTYYKMNYWLHVCKYDNQVSKNPLARLYLRVISEVGESIFHHARPTG